MQPTVFLFDIDGTLISTHGAAREALIRSFAEETGHHDAFPFSFAGMTDRSIMRGGFEHIGILASEAQIDEAIHCYLALLETSIADADIRIHPGARECVLQALAYPNSAVGLGTGNVEAGARLKLQPVGLNSYFSFGGFGEDGEAREALIAAGLQRGESRLPASKVPIRRVIIGDTPKDVSAAHLCGAECLAVATGGASYEELVAAGADCVVADLLEPSAAAFLFPAD